MTTECKSNESCTVAAAKKQARILIKSFRDGNVACDDPGLATRIDCLETQLTTLEELEKTSKRYVLSITRSSGVKIDVIRDIDSLIALFRWCCAGLRVLSHGDKAPGV